MAARSKARRRALEYLYASDLRGVDALAALDQAVADGEGPSNAYTRVLVAGVVENQARIDELLSAYAQGWTLDRMPVVDRNVLRLGAYEVVFVDEVPNAVAIDEALALVRDLSTDDSPGFVNGVLGAMVRDNPGRSPA